MKKYFKTEMIDKYLKKNNLTIDKFALFVDKPKRI